MHYYALKNTAVLVSQGYLLVSLDINAVSINNYSHKRIKLPAKK